MTHNIIGDKGTRRRPYNPNLADEVNREADADAIKAELKNRLEEAKRKKAGIPSVAAPATPPAVIKPSQITLAGDYITLENIVCTDADGNEFERYEQLYVLKDIFRDGKKQKNFTPYNAAVYCEQNGLFMPSFALTCNILQALYQQKSNSELKTVLDQYKDKGNGFGYHAQNTILDFGAETVIHYPNSADFDQTVAVNAGRPRVAKSFSKAELQDSLLEDALRAVQPTRYARQLTGLREPSILVEIGKYYGRPARLLFHWNGNAGAGYNGKRAAWLGCSNDSFSLIASGSLGGSNAARGVCLSLPAGRAL